jgi:putative SOS response-associated peptidase YedK
MCYDIAFLTQKAIKYAKRYGDTQQAEKLKEKYRQYHVSGFDHPEVPIRTSESPEEITISEWGMVPHWAKSIEDAEKIRDRTLNARDDTLYEKPSYRDAALWGNRCIITIDGFFEHHHFKGKTYPYFISRVDGEPISLAGLWSRWQGDEFIKHTFTIVTTTGNKMMSEIHNNPKLKGPRMPVIIPDTHLSTWLSADLRKEEVENLLQPYEDSLLQSWTVPRLRGKNAIGNRPEAIQKTIYEDLESQQGSLF